MDLSTIFGLVIGIGGIIAANSFDGGHFSSLLQFTAFLIVISGTIGATFVSNTRRNIILGVSLLKWAFRKEDVSYKQRVANEIIKSAKLARKESIVAVEGQLKEYSDPFMKNVFRFMADGVDPKTLRDVFENEIELKERHLNSAANIWLDAGGYAPTIGIIGAVLGLIHVMANLTDTAQLGKGIAVAFVATIYGIGFANLFFIPIGNKIKSKIVQKIEVDEMILEGAVAISSGLNPFIIEQKLQSYLITNDDV
jgi:chemotaxis protein MotA